MQIVKECEGIKLPLKTTKVLSLEITKVGFWLLCTNKEINKKRVKPGL
jgi:hypothetical protein